MLCTSGGGCSVLSRSHSDAPLVAAQAGYHLPHFRDRGFGLQFGLGLGLAAHASHPLKHPPDRVSGLAPPRQFATSEQILPNTSLHGGAEQVFWVWDICLC